MDETDDSNDAHDTVSLTDTPVKASPSTELWQWLRSCEYVRRERGGFVRQKFIEENGLPRQRYYDILNGKLPRQQAVDAIAKAFGVPAPKVSTVASITPEAIPAVTPIGRLLQAQALLERAIAELIEEAEGTR